MINAPEKIDIKDLVNFVADYIYKRVADTNMCIYKELTFELPSFISTEFMFTLVLAVKHRLANGNLEVSIKNKYLTIKLM